jgi:hypothetical protein
MALFLVARTAARENPACAKVYRGRLISVNEYATLGARVASPKWTSRVRATVQVLFEATARQVVAHLDSGEVSHAEVLDALEARVGAVDGAVNALPTLCFDRARAQAARIAALAVAERGPLGGTPVPN